VILEEVWYLPAVGCVSVMERHTTNTAFLMSGMSADNTALRIVPFESCFRFDMIAQLIEEPTQVFFVVLQVIDGDDGGNQNVVRLILSFLL
jgi:hypothetical protein